MWKASSMDGQEDIDVAKQIEKPKHSKDVSVFCETFSVSGPSVDSNLELNGMGERQVSAESTDQWGLMVSDAGLFFEDKSGEETTDLHTNYDVIQLRGDSSLDKSADCSSSRKGFTSQQSKGKRIKDKVGLKRLSPMILRSSTRKKRMTAGDDDALLMLTTPTCTPTNVKL